MGKIIDFNDGWAPITVRKPKDGQVIQIKGVPDGKKGNVIITTQYFSDVGFISNVTHWRPR